MFEEKRNGESKEYKFDLLINEDEHLKLKMFGKNEHDYIGKIIFKREYLNSYLKISMIYNLINN